jgi:hypothetical protein
MANVQIKLSIREEILQRLEEALERFPESRTTNLIACEVIEDYLDQWLEAEEYRRKRVKRQHAKLRKQRESTPDKRKPTKRKPTK